MDRLILLATGLLLIASPLGLTNAQTPGDPATAPATQPSLQPLSAANASMLNTKLSKLEANIAEIHMLDQQIAGKSPSVPEEIMIARLDRAWVNTLHNAVDYAHTVVDLRDQNFDVGPHLAKTIEYIKELPKAVRIAIDHRVARISLPDTSKSAAEQAQADEQFFAAYTANIDGIKALVTSLALAKRLGIDTGDEEATLSTNLQNAAINASVYLDIAQDDVAGLRAAVAVLPDDKELAAQLKIALIRVKRTADELDLLIGQMKQLNLPTAQFSQQLVRATGTVSASVFDIDVISGLIQSGLDQLMNVLVERGLNFVLQLLLFLLIVYVFYKLAGLVRKGIERALDTSHANVSLLLRDMILSSSRNLVIMLGIFIALAQLGFSLGPVLAGLGIAGVVIGFALQDSLANFASGMMILFYRPFDVGDTIQVANVNGKVSKMSLVNTTILTLDNKSLIVPNNKIWQDVITNMTARRKRRIDMEIGIAYNQDIDKVEKVLLDVIQADDRILKFPDPVIKVGSLSDSAVIMICRPWVNTQDYWDVQWDLNKRIKQAFDREGIQIPFPQRDVHIYRHDAPDDLTE